LPLDGGFLQRSTFFATPTPDIVSAQVQRSISSHM